MYAVQYQAVGISPCYNHFPCPYYFTVMLNGLNVFNMEFGVVSKLPGELHPNSQLNTTQLSRICCLAPRRPGFADVLLKTASLRGYKMDFFSSRGKVHDLNCWLPLGGSRGILPFLDACTTINSVTSRVAALSAGFDGRAVSHGRVGLSTKRFRWHFLPLVAAF